MNILVIGGSGFIGSHVVQLATKDSEVVVCDIVEPQQRNFGRWVRADVLEEMAIDRLLLDLEIDTIVHLVGLPVIDYCERSPHSSFLLNVVSVQNTLEAMRKVDVKKIVFASSAAVYGERRTGPISEREQPQPTSIYGYHKFIAEQEIMAYNRAYGIDYVILRLFNVYGAPLWAGRDVITTFIKRALKGDEITIRGPNKFRDFVRVSDAALAFVKALSPNVKNKTFNIGSGHVLTLRELGNLVKKYFPAVRVKELKTMDDGTGLQANIELAREYLDFKPIPPNLGVEEYIRSYSTH